MSVKFIKYRVREGSWAYGIIRSPSGWSFRWGRWVITNRYTEGTKF